MRKNKQFATVADVIDINALLAEVNASERQDRHATQFDGDELTSIAPFRPKRRLRAA